MARGSRDKTQANELMTVSQVTGDDDVQGVRARTSSGDEDDSRRWVAKRGIDNDETKSDEEERRRKKRMNE